MTVTGCTQAPPPTDEELPSVEEAGEDEIAVLTQDLDTPWGLAFAPDGRLFVTERPGTIRVVEDGDERVWHQMPETVEQGESGLMGLALHPGFPDPGWLYVCQTYRGEDEELRNRVVRIEATGDGPGRRETVAAGIDAGRIHDGCRLGFGPDDHLYVTMGDAADASRAQDETSRNGKMLRYTPEGQPAGAEQEGWHPAVFTMGHRNPQGLAVHPDTDTIYVSEHGPDDHDEINVLREGGNYGWPEVQGTDDGDGGYEPAIWTSGDDATVAPAGAAFVDSPNSSLHGTLLVATLADVDLRAFDIDEDEGQATVEGSRTLFDERFGRLRAVVWHEGAAYVSTSNEDGRGTPGPDDDRVLRVPASALAETA